jgi:hypothetical protein
MSEEHYSGKHSHGFWKRINKIKSYSKWKELYALGVELQNLEGKVLLALRTTEHEQRIKA